MSAPDLAQIATTFAAGAAGCLSMAKLLQTLERKRRESRPIFPISVVPAPRLFPDGAHDEMIAAIDELKIANRERRREYSDLKAHVERISEAIELP
jgi:hypothetical protein